MKAFYPIVFSILAGLAVADEAPWYDAHGNVVKFANGLEESDQEKQQTKATARQETALVFPVRASWGKRRFYQRRGRTSTSGYYPDWWYDCDYYPSPYWRTGGYYYGYSHWSGTRLRIRVR